ncbi:MAG: hypothetical protein KHX29_07900 [Prevotella buccalis]|nr:hypothetical protein [Hoylesella buccalis]
MNNAPFVLNFAGRHAVLSCKNDALCLLRQAECLLVKCPRSQRFFNTNAERFFNQLVDVLKISQGFSGFVICLMVSELCDFGIKIVIKK